MKICMLEKDITEIQADVCVSTVHHSKNLEIGKLSKSILKAGGERVQRDIKAISPHGERLWYGSVTATPPGNLKNNFRQIFFACIPRWNGHNAEKISAAVNDCCELAADEYLKTIALPCLGTGGLRYPENKSSEAIIEGLMNFALHHPRSPLQTVYISLYQKSSLCRKEWVNVFKKMTQAHNECIASVIGPVSYIIVLTETEEPRRDKRASLSTKDCLDKPDPISTTAGLPLFSAGKSQVFGPVEVHETFLISGRARKHGMDVDFTVRLGVTFPFLKKILSKFF